MKMRVLTLFSIIIFILLIIYRSQLVNYVAADYVPKRPSDVPNDAIWAGGIDGGVWYIISSQKRIANVWAIKIYKDNGSPWVRGEFWWKEAPDTKTMPPISAFDGHVIYLKGNKKMLPVGKHFYPHQQTTTVIIYPNPGPDYNELKQISNWEDKSETW